MAGTTQIKVFLTEEELQLPAIDALLNMYTDWRNLSKESAGGRKTRAANRRADTIFEEIMAFKLPPIKVQAPVPSPPKVAIKSTSVAESTNSSKSSIDSSDISSAASSEPRGRTLRPRSRTPSGIRKPPSVSRTPTNQSIRAAMKKNPDSVGSANVLSAALNQQHPSVSVNKLRQLLRADSAQKKREEEKEKSKQALADSKAKEERAEAQRKQMLEQRAETAKLKREQRLIRATELRKAREEAKLEQKLKEEQAKKVPVNKNEKIQKEKVVERPPEPEKPEKQNLTFHKAPEVNNIRISISDETCEEEARKQPTTIASWAKAPGLRDAIVSQFSKPNSVLLEEAMNIFHGVKLPVVLEEIFGFNQAVHNRYLCRTSSAVWSTPHRPLKRTSSDVLTPTDPKRPT